MNYKVSSIELFERQAKRLLKKYPSLKRDLAKLIQSKGKGKSGGARVITYLKVIATTVYLTSIYDKSEKSTITTKDLEHIFKIIP